MIDRTFWQIIISKNGVNWDYGHFAGEEFSQEEVDSGLLVRTYLARRAEHPKLHWKVIKVTIEDELYDVIGTGEE